MMKWNTKVTGTQVIYAAHSGILDPRYLVSGGQYAHYSDRIQEDYEKQQKRKISFGRSFLLCVLREGPSLLQLQGD